MSQCSRSPSSASFEPQTGLLPNVHLDSGWPETESFQELAARLVAEYEQLQTSASELRRENARLRTDVQAMSELLAPVDRRHGVPVAEHLSFTPAVQAKTANEQPCEAECAVCPESSCRGLRSPSQRWADIVWLRLWKLDVHSTWRNDDLLDFVTDVAMAFCKSGPDWGSRLARDSFHDSGERRHCIAVFHPYSGKRAIWDTVGMLMLIYECFAMPMAFTMSALGNWEGHLRFSEVFELVSVVYWTLDIVASFTTGYASAQGRIEMGLRKVARQYFRGFFAFDITVTTVDWLTFAFNFVTDSWSFARLGKTVWRLMRIIRLLRLMRVNSRMSEIVSRLNSELLISFFGVLRLLALVILINHYTACGWYFVSQVSDDRDNWAAVHLLRPSLGYAYLTALHWSLTQFTPASMEVHPYNEVERVYNISVIVLAMVVFSSFISSITNSMTHIQNLRAQQSKQESTLRRYLREHEISHELSGRVWHFVRTSRITRSRRVKLAEISCWRDFPNNIMQDLQLEIYLPVLVAHPVFDLQNAIEPSMTARICRDAASEQSLLAGDDLFVVDQVIDSMFFVTDGSILYSEQPAKDWMADECMVKKGEWACEIVLWAHLVLNNGVFSAYKHSEIVKINAEGFRRIMRQKGDAKCMLIRYANLYVDEFNAGGQQPCHGNLLFNSPEIVRQVLSRTRAYMSVQNGLTAAS